MKTATIMPDKAPIYPASISRLGGGGDSERRVLCANIMGVTQSIVEPEKDARLRQHPSILRDPDETPENPDAPDNGDRKPTEGLVNELESRLFKARKVMVFGQITDKLARDVVSRVLALVDESAKPTAKSIILKRHCAKKTLPNLAVAGYRPSCPGHRRPHRRGVQPSVLH